MRAEAGQAADTGDRHFFEGQKHHRYHRYHVREQ